MPRFGLLNKRRISDFRRSLLAWHRLCFRQLPWRIGATPFQVLVSEYLLKRTNTRDAWLAYEDVVRSTPKASDLAGQKASDIRRHLHSKSMHRHIGRIVGLASAILEAGSEQPPADLQQLLRLPGVKIAEAESTLAFAFGKCAPFSDKSTVRFLSRYFGVCGTVTRNKPSEVQKVADLLGKQATAKKLWQAVIDFSETVCTKAQPKCICCPLQQHCASRPSGKVPHPLCVDLFSGAGGLSLAAQSAGAVICSALESDDKAAATYEINFPNAIVAKIRLRRSYLKRQLAILGYRPNTLALLIAGPPCQGFSISNLRTRTATNPDNHAWRIALQAVSYLRPLGVVIENVGGMETFEDGVVVGSLLSSLRRFGYAAQVYRLNAADFGVPQRRIRLFIAGVRRGTLPDSIPTLKGQPTTVRAAINDLPLVTNGNEVDVQLYRCHGSALTRFQSAMRSPGQLRVRNCRTTRSTPLIVKRFSTVPQGGNWEDIPPELFANYATTANCHRWLYRRLDEHAPAVTISNFRKNMLIHPQSNRTLTVREAARLQGLPDQFIILGNLQSQQQQVANAVPPRMGEAVVRAVLESLRQ